MAVEVESWRPKKIEKVHRYAGQGWNQQANRLFWNPSMNPIDKNWPLDFGPRGSTMLFYTNALYAYKRLSFSLFNMLGGNNA